MQGEFESLIAAASTLEFGFDSDYQMDKGVPSWRESPQPGPTYFMSKDTMYIHILLVSSLGSRTGPTRFQSNYYYIRRQICAGSKDCNDTVYTLFDMFAAPDEPVCVQPPRLRAGYDEKGKLDEPAIDEAEPAAAGPSIDEAGPAINEAGPAEAGPAEAGPAIDEEVSTHI